MHKIGNLLCASMAGVLFAFLPEATGSVGFCPTRIEHHAITVPSTGLSDSQFSAEFLYVFGNKNRLTVGVRNPADLKMKALMLIKSGVPLAVDPNGNIVKHSGHEVVWCTSRGKVLLYLNNSKVASSVAEAILSGKLKAGAPIEGDTRFHENSIRSAHYRKHVVYKEEFFESDWNIFSPEGYEQAAQQLADSSSVLAFSVIFPNSFQYSSGTLVKYDLFRNQLLIVVLDSDLETRDNVIQTYHRPTLREFSFVYGTNVADELELFLQHLAGNPKNKAQHGRRPGLHSFSRH
ncbi:MAG: hypothetical protein HY537_03510 [Deltaproteobacteria bacterium]|nr:hypothetical protein [Deltaproteobacteria bacterium]